MEIEGKQTTVPLSTTTKRMYKVKQETIDQENFRSDVSSGAPNIKKRRFPNIFERLYAARKQPNVKHINKKKKCWASKPVNPTEQQLKMK